MSNDHILKMVAPSSRRANAWMGGIVQIWVTRNCDKSCFGCTQGSNLRGRKDYITVEQFRTAVESLKDYFGVVGVFGGNPALHPQFEELCEILKELIPFKRRGLWCNNPLGKGKVMQATFNPMHSNLNVHLDQQAFDEFKRDWPESRPFGLHEDSRHSPPWVHMDDVGINEETRWNLISNCDINKYWSAMIGVFRGGLRAWFCEIAGSQSINCQDLPDYPDTGLEVEKGWWKKGILEYQDQIKTHCQACGIPLRGYGELAQSQDGTERTSKFYLPIYQPKDSKRNVMVVESLKELQSQSLSAVTDYLGNSHK